MRQPVALDAGSGFAGRRTWRVGVCDSHEFRRSRTARKPAQGPADLRRHPAPPSLPAGRSARAFADVGLEELRYFKDEPAQKLMIELRRRQYPEPWGRSSLGEAPCHFSRLPRSRTCGKFHGQRFRPNGAILGVAGRIDWPALVDQVVVRRSPTGSPKRPRLSKRRPRPRDTTTCTTNRTKRRSASPTRASPIAIPTTSRPGCGGRAVGGHELASLYRGPRRARPVLQRVCQLPHSPRARQRALLRRHRRSRRKRRSTPRLNPARCHASPTL